MIVAMLRIKNEARWIAQVLDALKPVCERLLVMDDHSTDNTAEICLAHGAEVFPSPFSGGVDEARDKDWLLGRVYDTCPMGTWVLCIDGDEVLSSESVGDVRRYAATGGGAYMFRILYLWDSPDQVRTDGVYAKFSRPSMFQLRPGLSFRRTGAHGNLHCSNVPSAYVNRCTATDIKLLHLGYMDRSDRLRKFEWYTRQDPHNSAEDGYRHMVIGDVFPPDSVFWHGGPLDIRPL